MDKLNIYEEQELILTRFILMVDRFWLFIKPSTLLSCSRK